MRSRNKNSFGKRCEGIAKETASEKPSAPHLMVTTLTPFMFLLLQMLYVFFKLVTIFLDRWLVLYVY